MNITLLERTDCSGNVWYWIEGESDRAVFYPIPEMPKFYATENAVMHKRFNELVCSYAND